MPAGCSSATPPSRCWGWGGRGLGRARLGGDPNVLGHVLNIANRPPTRGGVRRRDFVFPYKRMLARGGFSRATAVKAGLPLELVKSDTPATGHVSLTRS